MNELILRFLNDLASGPLVSGLVVFLASTLPWFLVFGVLSYAVWHWRRPGGRVQLGFVGVVSISALLLAEVVKHFFSSPRPFLVLSDLHQLIQHGGNDSFPSGHATFFMALGTSLYLVNKKLGNIYIVGAVLIGLARVAAGIHWPTDILGGFVLAWVVVFAARFLVSRALGKPEHFRQF